MGLWAAVSQHPAQAELVGERHGDFWEENTSRDEMETLLFMFGSFNPICLIVFPNPEPCGKNCPLIDLETPSLLHQDLAALGKRGCYLSTE